MYRCRPSPLTISAIDQWDYLMAQLLAHSIVFFLIIISSPGPAHGSIRRSPLGTRAPQTHSESSPTYYTATGVKWLQR